MNKLNTKKTTFELDSILSVVLAKVVIIMLIIEYEIHAHLYTIEGILVDIIVVGSIRM
jgi:hypothetical protein